MTNHEYMTIEDIKELIEASESCGAKDISSLFELVLHLYEKNRIDCTDINQDGDMLLFQWGSYDWGEGRFFEVDLTRQVIPSLENPDDEAVAIKQLSVKFKFPHNQETSHLSEGNKWCSTPSEAEEFGEFIKSSKVYNWAKVNSPEYLEIQLGGN